MGDRPQAMIHRRAFPARRLVMSWGRRRRERDAEIAPNSNLSIEEYGYAKWNEVSRSAPPRSHLHAIRRGSTDGSSLIV